MPWRPWGTSLRRHDRIPQPLGVGWIVGGATGGPEAPGEASAVLQLRGGLDSIGRWVAWSGTEDGFQHVQGCSGWAQG